MRWPIPLALALMLLFPALAAALPSIDVVKTVAPAGKKPTRVVVEASNAGGEPVNGVRVDRADGGGSFAESSCGVRADGTYVARGGRFEVPVPGDPAGDVRVSVSAGSCAPGAPAPETTAQGFTLQLPKPGEVLPLIPLPAVPPIPGLPLPLAAASAGCKDADLQIRGRTRKRVRTAIICLVNVQRRAAGARKVRSNKNLQKAAAAQAADMRRRGYFAHEGSGGPDLVSRLERAKFWPASAGENLAAGTGALATARAVVDAWMNSDGHRVNMLSKAYKNVGVGIEPSFPAPPKTPGGTVAAVFGTRG
jgi:uncharacterized protein YkwD